MSKKEFACGVALSFDDMCSIGAACGAMSVGLIKNADNAEDVAVALHLAELSMRINAALSKVASEHKAQKESEGVGN